MSQVYAYTCILVMFDSPLRPTENLPRYDKRCVTSVVLNTCHHPETNMSRNISMCHGTSLPAPSSHIQRFPVYIQHHHDLAVSLSRNTVTLSHPAVSLSHPAVSLSHQPAIQLPRIHNGQTELARHAGTITITRPARRDGPSPGAPFISPAGGGSARHQVDGHSIAATPAS